MMGPLAEMDREGIAHRRVERGDRADRPPVKVRCSACVELQFVLSSPHLHHQEADMEVLELMEGVAQL